MNTVVLKRLLPAIRKVTGEVTQVRCRSRGTYNKTGHALYRVTGQVEEKIIDKHRTSPINRYREDTDIDEIVPLQERMHFEKKNSTFIESNPEFLPTTEHYFRDRILETVERQDMFKRRENLHIPEFYVGSIVAITVSDPYSPEKTNRFLGICIYRDRPGLRHEVILRNVIDDQGVEVKYDLYSPLIQQIEVIRFEKRLDKELFYLRDCPKEYSFFPQDTEPQILVKNTSCPINRIKVPLGPRPWSYRWERAKLQGVQNFEHLFKSKSLKKNMKKAQHPQVTKLWEEEDVMLHHRQSTDPQTKHKLYREAVKKSNQWKESDQ